MCAMPEFRRAALWLQSHNVSIFSRCPGLSLISFHRKGVDAVTNFAISAPLGGRLVYVNNSPSTDCCNELSRSPIARNQEEPQLCLRLTGSRESTRSPGSFGIVMIASMRGDGERLTEVPGAKSAATGCESTFWNVATAC